MPNCVRSPTHPWPNPNNVHSKCVGSPAHQSIPNCVGSPAHPSTNSTNVHAYPITSRRAMLLRIPHVRPSHFHPSDGHDARQRWGHWRRSPSSAKEGDSEQCETCPPYFSLMQATQVNGYTAIETKSVMLLPPRALRLHSPGLLPESQASFLRQRGCAGRRVRVW